MSGSCVNNAGTDTKPVITVSIEPQRWLLEQIVGDNMEIRTLLASGGNPESYEPAFSHLASLEESACYMQVGGLGFESAIVDKVRANNPNLPIVTVSDSIEYIVSLDHGHDHGIDPHVWSSARNARIMAENMLREVVKLDPKHEGQYTQRFIRLTQRIDSVDSVCVSLLTPMNGASFMVWHPSLSYFARDYGLQQVTVGAEGKEHSVTDTKHILEHIEDENVVVFFVQKDFDTSRAEVMAKDAGNVKVVTINPLNYEWDTELINTARAIAQ